MRPLVLTTRLCAPTDTLVGQLGEAGFRVTCVPTVGTEPVPPGGPLDRAVARLATYDWVVVTSRRGVEALAAAAARVGQASFASAPRPRWVAVGRATADLLEALGARDVLVPGTERALEIAGLFIELGGIQGASILLPRTDIADPDLPARLRSLGAAVDDLVAYRTVVAPDSSAPALIAALSDRSLAAIVAASPSAIRGLVRLAAFGGELVLSRLAEIPLVSIGPTTSQAVRLAGLRLAAQASEPSIDAIVAAVRGLGVPHPPTSSRGRPAGAPGQAGEQQPAAPGGPSPEPG